MGDDYQYLIYHYRIDRETGELKRYHRGRSGWRPAECGGMTTCRIVDGGGQVVGVGAAYCSMADNFCYRLGREIAQGRAKKNKRLREMHQVGFEVVEALEQVARMRSRHDV